jgi:murein DD-endopeptidase MepM/ murein hydrolase activator NlpD
MASHSKAIRAAGRSSWAVNRVPAVLALVLSSLWMVAAGPGFGLPAAADDTPARDSTQQTARDALALARQRLDDARTQATAVAEKLNAAQSEQARLQQQIADAERRIPELRARSDQLKAVVRERAVELYVRNGSASPLESTLDAASAEDGLRAAHLTDTIGRHDLDLAGELRTTAAKLADEEQRLEARNTELQGVVTGLGPLHDLMERRLLVASAAFQKVQDLTSTPTRAGTDVVTGASRCPVAGVSVFTDDFGEPRPGGTHPGIDMSALPETPVVAVVAGVMRHDVGGDGGNGAWLVGIDHVAYYYAHFSHYEGEGRLVAPGDVIGYVGSTGNATGPHLHFEVHPGAETNPPVDPFATLLVVCSGDPQTPNPLPDGTVPGR